MILFMRRFSALYRVLFGVIFYELFVLNPDASIILPKDCPESCTPREECTLVGDDRLISSICEVSEEGKLFVCCEAARRTPPATLVAEPQGGAAPGSQQRPQPAVSGCPLDPQRLECGVTTSDRIWRGDVALSGQFPWVVSLFYEFPGLQRTEHLCGGALITSRHVLTAAHCVVQSDAAFSGKKNNLEGTLVELRLGERILSTNPDCSSAGPLARCAPPYQSFEPKRITAHPGYSIGRRAVLNDIALVELDKPATFDGEHVFPVCLPCRPEAKVLLTPKANLVVAGWGAADEKTIRSDELRFAQVPIMGFDECRERFPFGSALVRDQHICAGGIGDQDACRGDSGGALTGVAPGGVVSYLVGLVSYGTQQCGGGSIGVYANVGKHLPWILENL